MFSVSFSIFLHCALSNFLPQLEEIQGWQIFYSFIFANYTISVEFMQESYMFPSSVRGDPAALLRMFSMESSSSRSVVTDPTGLVKQGNSVYTDPIMTNQEAWI
jgi:hypothetical protein